jgi:hypothetical protein
MSEDTALTSIVHKLLLHGADPNDLESELHDAVLSAEMDWALFGDGHWARNFVCSLCGSWAVGLCGESAKEGEPKVDILSRTDPRLHKNNPLQERILASEYRQRRTKGGN